ncbi:MAG: integrin alpha, partial [Pseudomonadota bacterium]|nr:integrin alpha [Pseudomonadota bacterium]
TTTSTSTTWEEQVTSTVEINHATTNGPTLIKGDNFGASVVDIGDLNSDGVNDLAVGANSDDMDESGNATGGEHRGAVHIFYMNTDGSVDSTVEINDSTANGPDLEDSDFFGDSVANIGDLNGDGVNDLAVGAYKDDAGGSARGAVHIMFMNTDGSVDSTVEINDSTANGPTLRNGDWFGVSVANIGDLNGDGVNDLAVGAELDDMDESGNATGGSARGAVHIMFMNTDGSVDSTVEINDSTANGPTLTNSDKFGISVANIGDLDGDGVNDLAVGAYEDATGGANRGAVHIMFMNTDGSVDSTVEINSSTANGPTLANADKFGRSVANIGDLDGDGVNDLAVGATGDNMKANGNEDGANRGAVHIIHMNTDGSVKSVVEINDFTTNGPSIGDHDWFG